LQSPVDSQETVVSSDSDPSMKTFVVKYGEYSITLKRPRHCFNVLNSATPDSPQSKRRIVSPISSDSSSESDYIPSPISSDYSSESDSDYSLDSSSSDRDSSTTSVSSDSEEPSSPWPMNIPTTHVSPYIIIQSIYFKSCGFIHVY
jgi:hypothetical protein